MTYSLLRAARIKMRLPRTGLQSKARSAICLPKPNVTDNPAKVGAVDIVLFAVKLWDTEKAAEQARPLVGENTRVITLQNGVDNVERIAPILGIEQTIGGVANISVTVAAPGLIRHPKIHFGRSDKHPDGVLDLWMPVGQPNSTLLCLPTLSARCGKSSFYLPPWLARLLHCALPLVQSWRTPSCAAFSAR
jgi:ketopantoate reductase